jgi:hypothetical protein
VRASRQGLTALILVTLGLTSGLAGCTRRPAPPPPPPPTSAAPTTSVAPTTTSPTAPAPTTPPTPPGVAPTSVTVRYGPFTIPATTAGGDHSMGMIHNAIATNVQRPCTNCYITSMQAGLTDLNGTSVNIDKGLWLHHMVLFDASKQDVTCPSRGPGLLGQRFFSSGNERTLTATGGPYGYPQGANARWNLIYDLMNMTAQARQVYITVTFEHVPVDTPGFKEITPVWLDINQCGNSERPAQTGQYSYDYTLTMPRPGKMIGIGGHLHDGGTNLTIEHNGELVCDSVPTYGGDPAYIEGPDSLHMPGTPHISAMSTCQGTEAEPVATVDAGDRLKLTANYDSTKHMQMHGEAVMGIAIGYFDMS